MRVSSGWWTDLFGLVKLLLHVLVRSTACPMLLALRSSGCMASVIGAHNSTARKAAFSREWCAVLRLLEVGASEDCDARKMATYPDLWRALTAAKSCINNYPPCMMTPYSRTAPQAAAAGAPPPPQAPPRDSARWQDRCGCGRRDR
jgi:hypothetical protein